MAKLKSIEFFDGFQSEITPSASLPLLGDVFVVADITARDALPIGLDENQVQESDVAVVTDATADPEVAVGGASYIYTGAAWQRLISPTDAVQSVNGKLGTVVVGTDDISEGVTNLYYSDARAQAALVAGLAAKQDINTDPFLFELGGEIDAPIFESYNAPVYVEASRTFTSAVITSINQIGDLTVEVRSYDNTGGAEVVHISAVIALTTLGLTKTSATLAIAPIGPDRFLKLYVKAVPNASLVVPVDGSLSVALR